MAYRWTMDDLSKLRSVRLTNITTSDLQGKDLQVTIKPKRSKYGNVKVTDASGAVHDSTKEYRRWCELQLRERAGEISQLHRQPVFDLVVNDVLVCRYEADASYVENATGERIVEDTKSEITRKKRDYRIKVKLLKATHGIEVKEV